jgi:hypothetical protein
MDRTELKILENNKNIQSTISVNTNILLRRFRLKFLRIMCSTSCYKERVNLYTPVLCAYFLHFSVHIIRALIMTLYTTMICVCSSMSSPDCKRKKRADDVNSVAKMSNVSLHLFQFFTYSFPIYNLVLWQCNCNY